jgi:hypothetical protein
MRSFLQSGNSIISAQDEFLSKYGFVLYRIRREERAVLEASTTSIVPLQLSQI